MKTLHIAAYIVLWVGGINWGLIGFFNYNLVESLLGAGTANWVYMLVGLSTVYVLFTHMGDCKVCGKK